MAPTGTYRLAFPAGERNFHERGHAPAPGRAARRRPRSRPRGRHRSATIGYPPELPVSQRRDDIAAAIRDHQVVIVAGETGSGKTTQLPKICLELGRGVAGQIGHTQPRRIAARTVAERIAEELGTDLGDVVGYKVRFTDKSGDNTAVKLMTDGILLAEIGSDRNLRRYDTLIIDEAHERSLNIDFILGYLRQLLPRRPDLKVIITSATIDPERFAEHFEDPRTGSPPRSSRSPAAPTRSRSATARSTTPKPARKKTATRSRPSPTRSASSSARGRATSSSSSPASGRSATPPTRSRAGPRPTSLPLYSRLSAAEQHRVFEPRNRRSCAGSCSPPTSPRPRSPCRASAT